MILVVVGHMMFWFTWYNWSAVCVRMISWWCSLRVWAKRTIRANHKHNETNIVDQHFLELTHCEWGDAAWADCKTCKCQYYTWCVHMTVSHLFGHHGFSYARLTLSIKSVCMMNTLSSATADTCGDIEQTKICYFIPDRSSCGDVIWCRKLNCEIQKLIERSWVALKTLEMVYLSRKKTLRHKGTSEAPLMHPYRAHTRHI